MVKCLRLGCRILGKHCQGLSAVAKELYRAGLMVHNRKKKLMHVDVAFHVTRHISEQSVQTFLAELQGVLQQRPSFPVAESGTDSGSCKGTADDCTTDAEMVAGAATEEHKLSDRVAMLEQKVRCQEQSLDEIQRRLDTSMPDGLYDWFAESPHKNETATVEILQI